ncbi:MAG: 2-hydroxyacid dehydrogenase [Dongiaceae bacterium]
MKPELLILAPMMARVLETLERDYQAHRLWTAPDKAALLAEIGPRIRAIATTGGRGAEAALIAQLPALEIISCYGVGVDAIDLPAARARGIAVTNTPDVLTDDVADLALALLLATSRRICAADRHVREGRWLKGDMPLTRKFSGSRVGIVGLGRIGQAIARRCAAFDCRIAWHGPRPKPDAPYPHVASAVDLARDSDFLVLACPGGAATRGLVNAAVLDALGPEGVLINISRGSVVDEPALVAALLEKRLGGAGLDVFVDEPRVPPALLDLENVVLLPHVASATVETRGKMGDLVIGNLANHFAGKPLITQVP